MTLGESLKKARSRSGLTQREVAQKANMNYKTLSNWENDVSRPSPDDLARLATIYQVSVDSILGRPVRLIPVDDTTPFGRAVIELQEQAGYYRDPKVAQRVDELKNRPGLRILFDASRDLSDEDIDFVVQFVERLKKKEK